MILVNVTLPKEAEVTGTGMIGVTGHLVMNLQQRNVLKLNIVN